ncbi:MAG: hypothetical protein AABX33_09120 [Nanoarchaeota archaeon]
MKKIGGNKFKLIWFAAIAVINIYSVLALSQDVELKTTTVKFLPNYRFDEKNFNYNSLNFDSNERI